MRGARFVFIFFTPLAWPICGPLLAPPNSAPTERVSEAFEQTQSAAKSSFQRLGQFRIRNAGVAAKLPVRKDGSPLPHADALTNVLEFMHDPARFFDGVQRLERVAYAMGGEHVGETNAAEFLDRVLRKVEGQAGFLEPVKLKEFIPDGRFNNYLRAKRPLDDFNLTWTDPSDMIPGHGQFAHRTQWAVIALEIEANPQLYGNISASDLYAEIGQLDSEGPDALDWSATGIQGKSSVWKALVDQPPTSASFSSPEVVMSYRKSWPLLKLR